MSTTTTCIVQARMGSTRLPGKVLSELGGMPMLAFMLRRLQPLTTGSTVDNLVVATSTTAADDAIAALCADRGIDCVRGPEDDVVGRFAVALDRYPADVVVRLTGDCPLSDPAIVADALALQASSGADYVSNTLIRTYPDGLDVEVLTAGALRAASSEATGAEREHVTPFVYRRTRRFTLRALRTDELAGDERWTVDTPEDMDALRAMVAAVGDPESAGWRELLEVTGRQAGPQPGALWLRPAVASDSGAVLAWRNDPVAVEFSQTGTTVDPEDHARWFAARLVDPRTRLWIGEVDGAPVGQVRVDVDDAVGLVSVGVAPEHRGRGHALALLLAMQRALRADLQVELLVADIHPGNAASLRTFDRAGFEPAGDHDGFLRFHWRRP